MIRRLFVVIGLCIGVVFALASATPAQTQEDKKEKHAAGAKVKQDRLDGTVQSIDTKTKTISVRVRGQSLRRDVIYDDSTKITFRNKAAKFDDVQDGRRVICLGKINDKGQFIATRIDVRE
jgi:hypothetical protein